MIINNYELPDDAKKLLRIGYTPEVLREPVMQKPEDRPVAVIWREAMYDMAVEAGMRQPDWPIKIISSLAKHLGWNWDAKHSRNTDEVITDPKEILSLARLACGVASRPEGNIIVTLNLRSYQDKCSDVGGFNWWSDQRKNIQDSDVFVSAFLSKLTDMLHCAYDSEIGIYTEQMSLVIAKDSMSPIATLVPILHSDLSYGERESTLCSLLEPGYNPYGGVLSVPTIKMTALEKELPIDIHKLFELLPDVPIVKVNSGDIMLHDGMIGPDGKAVLERGLPHISPDLPGKSSRIVFLMRHKALS